MSPQARAGTPGLLAIVLSLAACSSAPLASPPVVAPATSPGSVASAPVTDPAPHSVPPTSQTVAKLPPYLDRNHPLYQTRSYYFDFDQTLVKAEYAQALQQHGQFLAANPTLTIRIEGNTDETGGTEYNLALGQKRADAVVKALRLYGARDAQLEAISFGKEKPKDPGHGDAAHAQNRRADLAYPAQ
jgi:peptidoglycan-associated lipoprotein